MCTANYRWNNDWLQCGCGQKYKILKGDIQMILSDTVELMNSKDYKERLKGEYLQLKIRMNGLSAMLKKYKSGELNFTPSCSYDLLNGQFEAMSMYALILEERARIENINLDF